MNTKAGTINEKLNVPNLSNTELIANVIYIDKSHYNLGEFFRASWGKVFDSALIRKGKCTFPEGLKIGEDAIFVLQYLPLIRNVNLISEKGYNYNRNISSATNTYMPDCYEQCKMQADLIERFLKENIIIRPNSIQIALINFYWWMFVSLFENNLRGLKQKKVHLNDIFNDSEKWVNEYFDELKNAVDEPEKINSRYRMLYDYFHKNNGKYPTAKSVTRWYMKWKVKHKLKLV